MMILRVLLGPLLFLLCQLGLQHSSLPPGGPTVAGLCLWMMTWWITETLPLAITALLPLIVLPAFTDTPISTVAASYGSEVLFLFLGGFLLSKGIEASHLHERLGDRIVKHTGNHPGRFTLAMMFSTAFLSFWISNTAAALMMIPLAQSVERQWSEHHQNQRRSLILGIAYAASLGGIATPVGSPPNAVLLGFLQNTKLAVPSFLTWMISLAPLAIVGVLVTYFYLTRVAFPSTIKTHAMLSELVHNKPKAVEPPLRNQQRYALFVFCLTVVLWIARSVWSWTWLSDASVALLGGLLMFLVPAEKSEVPTENSGRRFMLNEKSLSELPWPILTLFGGGIALSDAMDRGGLGRWVHDQMAGVIHWPPFWITLALVAVVMIATEFGSNTAVTLVFLPLTHAMFSVQQASAEPILFAVALAASLSFMLPMATPPNAVAYSVGHVGFRQMMRAGFGLNLIFAALIAVWCSFVLPWMWSYL